MTGRDRTDPEIVQEALWMLKGVLDGRAEYFAEEGCSVEQSLALDEGQELAALGLAALGRLVEALHELSAAATEEEQRLDDLLDVAIQERDEARERGQNLVDGIGMEREMRRDADARLERVEAARRAIAALEADELDMYRECRAEGSNAEAAQHDSRLSAYRKSLALLAAALSDVTPPPSEPGPERETAHRVTHVSGSGGGAAGAVDE